MHRRFTIGLIICTATLFGSVQVSRADSYTFTTIEAPGSSTTDAHGINNAGQIVGDFVSPTKTLGFLDDHGTFTTIDVPGGSLGTQLFGINDAGQIVGGFLAGSFLYNQGTFTTIGAPGNRGTQVASINNAGQIVGSFYNGTKTLGFLYNHDHGTFTTIDVPGSVTTNLFGINDAGQIVGWFSDNEINVHSFLYDHGTFTTIEVPGSSRTSFTSINNAGQIVGDFVIGPKTLGFLYDHGTFTTIDVPGPGSDINNTIPSGINDAGQIVGTTFDYSTGKVQSFLATPTPIPEPTSLALLAAGLVGIGILRWRKQNRIASNTTSVPREDRS